MKIIDALILIMLFVLIGIGSYILWRTFPSSPLSYEEYSANITGRAEKTVQFYPNMRYKDRIISYSVESSCDNKKRTEVEEAFTILSEKTILRFYSKNDGEIRIMCSEIASKPEEKNHFIAGEGGPSIILNTSRYYIINSGRISLFRRDRCESPQIALHEILHSLGFDHNANESSIMYPVTNCDQKIDDYIIDAINTLYREDSLPDLVIEKVSAVKRGIYLDFNITIGNNGLKNAKKAKLTVYSNNNEIKSYEIDNIDISVKTILNVQNLKILRDSEKIKFEIDYSDSELSKSNNIAELSLNE